MCLYIKIFNEKINGGFLIQFLLKLRLINLLEFLFLKGYTPLNLSTIVTNRYLLSHA